MDEEDAMKNVTRKDKKIKPKYKRGEKSEVGSMERRESRNIGAVDATEHVLASGKEEFAEMKKDLKKNKANKTKRSNDVESEIKKGGSKKMELSVAYGEDCGGNPADNVERKMKRREKNKTSHSKEVEKNEWKNGESISGTDNSKDASKEKKHKRKRKLEDVDFEEVEIDGKEAEHGHNSNGRKGKRRKRRARMIHLCCSKKKCQIMLEKILSSLSMMGMMARKSK